jgi:hypothetical protein
MGGEHMIFIATQDAVIYGIPYVQGDIVDTTGWVRKQYLQFLSSGLIAPSNTGGNPGQVLTSNGGDVPTWQDTGNTAGAVCMFASKLLPLSFPFGWHRCDGTSLYQADYPELFSQISTTFGSVDANSFTLPTIAPYASGIYFIIKL